MERVACSYSYSPAPTCWYAVTLVFRSVFLRPWLRLQGKPTPEPISLYKNPHAEERRCRRKSLRVIQTSLCEAYIVRLHQCQNDTFRNYFERNFTCRRVVQIIWADGKQQLIAATTSYTTATCVGDLLRKDYFGMMRNFGILTFHTQKNHWAKTKNFIAIHVRQHHPPSPVLITVQSPCGNVGYVEQRWWQSCVKMDRLFLSQNSPGEMSLTPYYWSDVADMHIDHSWEPRVSTRLSRDISQPPRVKAR